MRRLRVISAFACTWLCAAAAHASPTAPTPADKEAARALAEKGFEQFQAGDCKAATASFEAAEQRFHAPPHRLFVARCDVKAGKLLEAHGIYREILDEKLAPDAPAPFRDAQNSAKGEFDETDIRLPTLRITLARADTAGLVVLVDGAPIPVADLGHPKQLDPGTHTVSAKLPSGERFERTVALKDGGGGSDIEIAFAKETKIAPVAARSSYALPITAFAVGGAALGLGVITGIGSLGKVSDLKDACGADKHCPPAIQPTASAATALGTLSTVAFIVGAAGVGVGVTLLVIRPAAKTPDAAATPWLSASALASGIRLDARF